MHSIYTRLKAAFPFLGTRAATEDDAVQFCEKHGIELRFRPAGIDGGIYAVGRAEGYPDVHAIFVNSRLQGFDLLHVLFHEIGHFLFHDPPSLAVETYKFSDRTKQHREAESVAALLLIPAHTIEELVIAGEFYANERLGELISLRLELYTNGFR